MILNDRYCTENDRTEQYIERKIENNIYRDRMIEQGNE